MKDTRNLSSLIVGQVMDRALMEIKDGDHQLFMRIVEKKTIYKLTPIAYKVDKKTECWICLTAAGSPYPQVRFKGKTVKVSRLIFKEFTGIAPGKDYVLHSCDNPECINPTHLRLGTAKDNSQDLKERGKSKHYHYKPMRLRRKRVSTREYWGKKLAPESHQTQKTEITSSDNNHLQGRVTGSSPVPPTSPNSTKSDS
jgi:hypothetical protein